VSLFIVPNLKKESFLGSKASSESLGLILGSAFVIAIVLLLTSIVVYKIRKNTRSVLTKEDIDEFMNGIISVLENDQSNALNYACMPYNKDREVDSQDFTIG